MLILPRSLLCYLFWALTLPLYMWLSVPLCVCVCVCLFSGLMCALDCAQIAQVQLKLSIQFLSSYCAIFKNLNSIFIIAVGPLVLSSRNIIMPTSFATSSWSSSSGSSSAPSSLSAVALLLLSHWHLIPLFALRLALSHGHLVAYCNVLHSYRYSPPPSPLTHSYSHSPCPHLFSIFSEPSYFIPSDDTRRARWQNDNGNRSGNKRNSKVKFIRVLRILNALQKKLVKGVLCSNSRKLCQLIDLPVLP